MPAAQKLSAPAPTPVLEYGRVLGLTPSGVQVQTSFATLEARRAVSCLVEPSPGDTALLAVDLSGGAWVLSVLESAHPVRMSVEGDASLNVSGGSLTLAADDGLNLAARGRLGVAAGSVSLHASRAQAVIERVSLAGKSLTSQFKRISLAARSMDQIFRRFTMRAQESTRFVKEHDEVQAGSQRVLVEDLCALHARNHSMMAEEHVVINAEQIHMG